MAVWGTHEDEAGTVSEGEFRGAFRRPAHCWRLGACGSFPPECAGQPGAVPPQTPRTPSSGGRPTWTVCGSRHRRIGADGRRVTSLRRTDPSRAGRDGGSLDVRPPIRQGSGRESPPCRPVGRRSLRRQTRVPTPISRGSSAAPGKGHPKSKRSSAVSPTQRWGR